MLIKLNCDDCAIEVAVEIADNAVVCACPVCGAENPIEQDWVLLDGIGEEISF